MTTLPINLTREESRWISDWSTLSGYKSPEDGIREVLKVVGAIPRGSAYFKSKFAFTEQTKHYRLNLPLMTKKIENKVSLKLYGDRKLEEKIVELLINNGYKPYGRVEQGNPYTTQKGDSGWASSVTLFGPEDAKE